MSVTSKKEGPSCFEGTISRVRVFDLFGVGADLTFSCVDGLNDSDLVVYPGGGWTRVGHGLPKAERTGVE